MDPEIKTASRRHMSVALWLAIALFATSIAFGASSDPESDSALFEQVENLFDEGKYGEALTVAMRVLELRESDENLDQASVAVVLNKIGTIHVSMGTYDKAKRFYDRALQVRRNVFGPEHENTAKTLNDLGVISWYMGDLGEAKRYFEQSFEIRLRTIGENHADTAGSASNLGMVSQVMGDFTAAIVYYERALQIAEGAFPPNDPRLGAMLTNLGLFYLDMGDLTAAKDNLENALDNTEISLGSGHPRAGLIHTNLGTVLRKMGEAASARVAFERALEIVEATLGPDSLETASSLTNLGSSYADMEDFDSAIDFYERSLRIEEAKLGVDNSRLAVNFFNLGEAYAVSGNYDAAISYLQRALQILAQTDLPLETAEVQAMYSTTLAEIGHLEEAILFGKFAVNGVQEMRRAASGLDASLQQSFLDSKEPMYRQLADQLISEGRLAEAQQVLEMLKEEEYFDYVRRNHADLDLLETRAAYSQSELPWFERYEEIKGSLVRLAEELTELENRQQQPTNNGKTLSDADLARIETLRADQVVARHAFEEYLTELRDVFARAGGERAIEFGQKDLDSMLAVQGALRRIESDTQERVVLLSYLVTDERLRILVTTPRTQVHRDSLVTAEELNRQIFAFREVLQDPRLDALAPANQLYQSVIAPVAEDLEQAGADTVLLSLDGTLRYAPLSALHDGEKYLADRFAFGLFTPAARLSIERRPQETWQAAGLGVSKPEEAFQPLPSVQIELSQIIRELPPSGDAALRGEDKGVLDGKIWLDEEFDAEALTSALRTGYPVVHLASHFVFRPGTEADSFLVLGNGERLTLSDFVAGDYPFESLDLLTLSACETALGSSEPNGREIEGFGALAQNRGASAVLATLWPVADASTAEFMTRFYRYRQESKLTKSKALQRAQRDFLARNADLLAQVETNRGLISDNEQAETAMRGDLSHPYYWAPFILMGNWQ